MLTSKERAELRAQANALETTLMVGKEGISPTLLAQAETQLTARELIKGRVLETAMLSAREVSDALCEATGADGVQTVGSKFVIYLKNEKKAQQAAEKKMTERKALANPVRKGVQKRRMAAKEARQKKNEYYKQAAIEAAIEKRRAAKRGE